MKTKSKLFISLSVIGLMALVFSANVNINNLSDSDLNLKTLLLLPHADAEGSASDCCKGSSCSLNYDYNDFPWVTCGCCGKYTTTTGKRP